MNIDYDHSRNLHTTNGPRAALPHLFASAKPKSLLDVGCGTGTWLKEALDFGIPDVFGVDGVEIAKDNLLIPKNLFRQQDLTKPWKLGRHFDAALCLEVAEHLDASSAPHLVKSLTAHSDTIYFSAACPGQPGQHHVHCQWPEFWQELFNKNGFACKDEIRPKIWNVKEIEVWYRQNIFTASRSDTAGREPRLPGMVHSEFLPQFLGVAAAEASKVASDKITLGRLPFSDYPKMTARALVTKVKRKIAK